VSAEPTTSNSGHAALFIGTYEMAVQTAREAQQALRYELGDTSLSFLTSALSEWNSLHEGLLTGEKLELALHTMERAYMNKNCREYELTKHVSLRLHFPATFVLLKATGCCEIDVPEWLFDLDYPGHYMRRIRSVSLTIPCVAGPYTGVHCRLQQFSSSIRVSPTLSELGACSCCLGKNGEKEAMPTRCVHDPHVWTRYAGTEAIATSSGQNDAGLFEVSFNDVRYLPFEFTGAVARWRIELPPENNQFNFDSLSDLVMHVNFTAREDGPEFARQCSEAAQAHLPGDGWRFFDVRHEMPEVWSMMRRSGGCEACKTRTEGEECCIGKEPCHHHQQHHQHHKCDDYCGKKPCEKGHGSHGRCDSKCGRPLRHTEREFHLMLTRQMFPFLTGRRGVAVTGVHLLTETNCEDIPVFRIRFTPPRHALDDCCPDTESIPFVRTAGGIWSGNVNLKEAVPLPDRGCQKGAGIVGCFRLPCELKNVCGAWLLCSYRVLKEC
jgi:hypothetical protein